MKKNHQFLPILLFFFSLFSTQYSFAQMNSKSDKFVSLVMEVSEDVNGETVALITSKRIVNKRLKSLPKSDQLDGLSDQLFVQIKTEDGLIVDQLIYDDPLTGHYEYVNDDDQLEHVHLRESKRAFNIRLPYLENMKNIQVIYSKNGDEKVLLNESIE